MADEPDIMAGGHHDVGDDRAFQAAHPVGQDLARHPAHDLKALGQQPQRRGGPLLTSEPHEPEPGSGQHRAERMQPGQHTPSRSTRCSPGDHTAGRRPW